MRLLGSVYVRALLLTVGLLLLGLGANSLWPRGIELSKDYFPAVRVAWELGDRTGAVSRQSSRPTELSVSQEPALRVDTVRLDGNEVVGAIGLAEARRLWESPDREAGLILFIDARSPQAYASGHIPGARLFYHYRAEQYLPEIRPLCDLAERIVIYCSGGECEDSRFAAGTLIQLGVPSEKIRIFTGGIRAWKEAGLPLEQSGGEADE